MVTPARGPTLRDDIISWLSPVLALGVVVGVLMRLSPVEWLGSLLLWVFAGTVAGIAKHAGRTINQDQTVLRRHDPVRLRYIAGYLVLQTVVLFAVLSRLIGISYPASIGVGLVLGLMQAGVTYLVARRGYSDREW